MLYLVNQQCPNINMEFVTQDTEAIPDIEQAFKTESLVVALDEKTQKKLDAKLPFTLPGFGFGDELDQFEGLTPDDVALMLPDNLELGDEILAVEDHKSLLMFYKYTKWD